MDFFQQLLISLFGGFIGGGLIVSWIELKRYKRESKLWSEEDKKLLIHINTAIYSTQYWDGKSISDADEKIRVFESGLDGNISSWSYLLKFSLENVSKRDLLIETIDFDFPSPMIIKSEINKKYSAVYNYPIKHRYDMFNKLLLQERDFPLLISSNSTIGIVIIGINNYDYPFIVSDIPNEGRILVAINKSLVFDENVSFTKKNNLYNEIGISCSTGQYHWSPYLQSINEEEEIPF